MRNELKKELPKRRQEPYKVRNYLQDPGSQGNNLELSFEDTMGQTHRSENYPNNRTKQKGVS
jgi:hypothetical protein